MKSGVVGWIGMTLSLSGVVMQTVFPQYIPFSFWIFLTANVLWFANGLLTRNKPLMAMQATTGVLNVHALMHWFGT